MLAPFQKIIRALLKYQNKVTFITYFSSPGKERDTKDFTFANTTGNKAGQHDMLLPELSDVLILQNPCLPFFWIKEMLPLLHSLGTYLFHGDARTAEQKVMYNTWHAFIQNK